jgi:hypothetical protein
MLATYAADRRSTGSPLTSRCQTLSAGNTGHATAAAGRGAGEGVTSGDGGPDGDGSAGSADRGGGDSFSGGREQPASASPLAAKPVTRIAAKRIRTVTLCARPRPCGRPVDGPGP